MQYVPLTQLSQPWRICVLLPNGQNKFWWGVAWGITEDAKRHGIQLGIYDAGGYDHIDVQQRQLKRCMQLNADAYLIASVTVSGLTPLLQQLKTLNKPVIDLMNGLPPEWVTSRTDGSTKPMVEQLVSKLELQKFKRKITVAWFPGPTNAHWVEQAHATLMALLPKQRATIVTAGYAGTAPFAQANLVRQFFKLQDTDFDYIIANAVAANLIALYQQKSAGRSFAPLYSFYTTPDVVNLIRSGQVVGAANNQPVIQARIALDLALRALEQKPLPRLVQPPILWLDNSSIKTADLSTAIAPKDYWLNTTELSETLPTDDRSK